MAVNLTVTPRPGETSEAMALRPKKLMLKLGVWKDMRRHAFALKPGEARRMKQARARRAARKAAQRRAITTAHVDRIYYKEYD